MAPSSASSKITSLSGKSLLYRGMVSEQRKCQFSSVPLGAGKSISCDLVCASPKKKTKFLYWTLSFSLSYDRCCGPRRTGTGSPAPLLS